MIQIIPNSYLDAEDIKLLSDISKRSSSEIRKASVFMTPVREIKIFKTDWEQEKVALIEIYRHFAAADDPPFTVREVDEFGLNELLTPEQLKSRIEHWRGIEVEAELSMELELGEISTPDQFVPSSKDWA